MAGGWLPPKDGVGDEGLVEAIVVAVRMGKYRPEIAISSEMCEDGHGDRFFG